MTLQASEEEIRNAYRKWSLLFHPDRHAASEDVEKSSRKFQLIQTAYDVLSDKKLRQEYDHHRNERSKNWYVGKKGKDVEEVNAL